MDVPQPGPEAPEEAILILPADGREVYRLVRNEPASSQDFQPRYGKAAAFAAGVTELRRQGLSHYLERGDAEEVNEQDSMLARVRLEPGYFDFARTGPQRGHLDVWGRVDHFVQFAETEE